MNIGRFRQSHTALASAFGSLIMGLVNAWPSYTTELYLSKSTPLTLTITRGEEALLGSLPSLGAMVGSAIVGLIINRIGRRYGGVIVSLPVLIGWAIISVTTSIKFILAARFFAGISGGAALVLAPIFTSEVAEDAIRGTLASASMFLYSLGVLISYILGWSLTYNTIIWVNLIFSLTCIILLALTNESPVYLLRQNRDEEAKLSIAKYRGVPMSSMVVIDEFTKLKQQLMPSVELVAVTDIDPKAEEAEKEKLNKKEIEPEIPQSTSTLKLLFLQPSSRWAFVVVTTVVSMQVYMGMVPVQVYAKTVFRETDPSKADIYTILFAVVLFAGAGVTVVITDKAGRRLLIIASSVMVFICMMTLGFLIQSKVAPPLVTVLVVFAYSFSFMFGAGTIPYVLLAEVFIPEVQNLASMIIIELVWFHNFLIIGIFPIMNSAFGIHGTFYIFGVVAIINAIISYFIVPETKGLSNTQIQESLMLRKKH